MAIVVDVSALVSLAFADEDRLYVAETHTGRLWSWAVTGPGQVDTAGPINAGGALLHGAAGLLLVSHARSLIVTSPSAVNGGLAESRGVGIGGPSDRDRAIGPRPCRPARRRYRAKLSLVRGRVRRARGARPAGYRPHPAPHRDELASIQQAHPAAPLFLGSNYPVGTPAPAAIGPYREIARFTASPSSETYLLYGMAPGTTTNPH